MFPHLTSNFRFVFAHASWYHLMRFSLCRVFVVVILKHCLDAEENLFDRQGRLPSFFIAATAREEREGERKWKKKVRKRKKRRTTRTHLPSHRKTDSSRGIYIGVKKNRREFYKRCLEGVFFSEHKFEFVKSSLPGRAFLPRDTCFPSY